MDKKDKIQNTKYIEELYLENEVPLKSLWKDERDMKSFR